jgi:predicted phosphohydrolase
MISLLPIKLDDDKAERSRRNHHDALLELQRITISRDNIRTVTLVEGADTKVAHKLGKAPTMVIYSPIRGAVAAGRIDEVLTDDRSKQIVLRAIGFGADVTLEVLVI